ncbi:hypothetical protein GCM10007940_40640 [Portibacter lacus]|uniref:Uncharacterized protein n=2 Tax=Portibacter lacus TaxID=1099794 RepID=A0AA37SS25_9BACT|nr:hypothetical protein GCM10007940_40640 [Portibacter lacus]
MFGPDDRLYVLNLNGTIDIFTVVKNGPNDYEVTSEEELLFVKNIPNHNDDGSSHTGNSREATGLTVVGTPATPIIYVTSSDSRVGGPSGDKNLDTNSGVITRLTKNGNSWDVVDIVRGLSRSEENHATNGLEFVTIGSTDYLIVCSGGHANAGAPSDNFAWTTEYALSAALLSINLTQLEGMPIKTDGSRQYIYDIPTLDDPTRDNVFSNGSPASEDPNDANYSPIDIGDPWGGNDGLNQGMIVINGPVQIFSPGYRNSYDLVITELGKVFATDNGANGGWGGLPENEGIDGTVTNNYLPSEPGSSSSIGGEQVNNKDHLTMITNDIHSYALGSFYGGHPCPVRANPAGAGLFTNPTENANTNSVFRTQVYDPDGSTPGSTNDASIALPANWPPVPVSLAQPEQGDWRAPGGSNPDGPDDVLVTTWSNNTNGIDEYTASNFGNAMKGDLIAGKNGGVIKRVQLTSGGGLEDLDETFVTNLGGNALGITCNGDDDPFPGTIWVATYNGNVKILEPVDAVAECYDSNDPLYNENLDYDFDGYTNGDEIDNKGIAVADEDVICSAGSQPNDFDRDAGGNLVSDLNDDDDDNDGILDKDDPFQIGDFHSGGSDAFNLPVINELASGNTELNGYLGLGFTGLMNNGSAGPNWIEWIDIQGDGPNPDDLLGGAIEAMTMQMGEGTALGNSNNQRKAFQYGVNVSESTGGFIVEGRTQNFDAPLQLYGNANTPNGEVGIFLGDGTQSNYMKLVLTKSGITFQQEINDSPQTPITINITTQNRPLNDVVFRMSIDPVSGNVTALYAYGEGEIFQTVGTLTAQGSVLSAIKNSNIPLAVGLIGTSNASNQELECTWDYLNVIGSQPTIEQTLNDINVTLNAPSQSFDLNNYFEDNDGDVNLTYTIEENTNSSIGASISNDQLTISFTSSAASSSVTIRATDQGGLFIEQQFDVNVNEDPVPILRIRANGATITATDAPNPNWLGITATGAQSGTFNGIDYAVNTGNHSTHNITQRHASLPSYAPTALFASERWDPPVEPEMEWTFDVPNGDYTIRLYLGNGYAGTDSEGDRQFNILIEGLQKEYKFDAVAQFGHQTGGMIQHSATVTDNELNILFEHDVENPLINAIEILGFPIVVETIADQTSNVDEVVNLTVLASGGASGPYTYSATGLPDGLQIEPTTGLIFGTVASSALVGSPYNVEVTVSKSNSISGTASFSWLINGSVPSAWNDQSDDENYTARHECSFVQAGNKFYLFGGRENPTTLDVYSYDTKTWTSIPNSAPMPFNHFQAIEYQGLIWVISAFMDNGFPNEMPAENIYTYNPATNEWTMGPEIPAARQRGSAGVVMYNDKFYIIGGNQLGHNGQYVPWFDEFDPATGIWTALTNLDAPRSRDHFHAGIVGDKIYLAGGRLSGGDGGTFAPLIAEVDVFDFNTDSWSTLPQDIPTPRAAPSVAVLQNKLYVIGGEIQTDLNGNTVGDAVKTTEILDPVSGTWTSGPDLVTERHGTQAIASGDGIHVAAGSNSLGGGGKMKSMEYYGLDNPTGSPSVSGQLNVPTSVVISAGGSAPVSLSNQAGNVGIIITGTTISGPDASEFILSESIDYGLLASGATRSINVIHTGSTEGKFANLTITYDVSGSVTIPISTGTSSAVTLYRINAGGAIVSANDAPNIDWSSDQASGTVGGSAVAGTPSPYVNITPPAFDKSYGIAFSGTNSTGYPDALFSTERYSDAANPNNMQWDFPVANGDYIVNLLFAEVWSGATEAGVRVFDVEIEGNTVLANFDQTDTYGHNVAGVESFNISVSDGNLDIDFIKNLQNPSIKGIEIISGAVIPNDPPIVTSPGIQNSAEGDVISLQIVATDVDPCFGLNYSASGLPPTLSIDPATGLISGTISESTSGGAFDETNGVLIIEAETDFVDGAGGWNLISGTPSFLAASTDHFGNTNGQTIDYDLNISTPGVYRLHMKSEFTGTIATEENDTWFKVANTPDVHFFTVQGGGLSSTTEFENILSGGTSTKTIYYPKGNGQGRPDHGSENPGNSGFFKIYRSGSGGNKWDAKTIDNNGFPVYAYFPNAGTYTIQMSERSAGHKIDRFALLHIDDVSTGVPTGTLNGAPSTKSAPGAADGSPYSVTVIVTDGCNPSASTQVVFDWNVFEAGSNSLEITCELQGRTDHSGTYHVQICDPSNGQSVLDDYFTANASGTMTILNTPVGNYDVLVSYNTYLSKAEAGVKLSAGANSLVFNVLSANELRAGDANNSGAVTITDFSILASSFDKISGDAGYNPNADFNGSGGVTIGDFSLLASNFENSGDDICVPPMAVGSVQVRTNEVKLREAPEDQVNYILSAANKINIQDEFSVTLTLLAEELAVDGSDLLLKYSPKTVEVVDVNLDEIDFGIVLKKEINEQEGFIRISLGSISNVPTGDIDLGKIRFRAVQPGQFKIKIDDVSEATSGGFILSRNDNEHIATIIAPVPELKVYPNPASDIVTVSIGKVYDHEEYTLELYNSQGQILMIDQIQAGHSKMIKVRSFPPGIYFVRAKNSESNYNKKFIVE